MFRKKQKRLIKEGREVLSAFCDFVREGKIGFSGLTPLIKDHYQLIEAKIREREDEEYERRLSCFRNTIERQKGDVDYTKQKLDKCIDNITEAKAELESQKSKKGFERDEARIKFLLWSIFNSEECAESLEEELKQNETRLKEAEENLNKFLEEK